MPDPQNTDPGPSTDEEKAEQSFWEKLDARIDAGVDRAIEKHVRNRDSRNGGRPTLPGMLADMMFGKSKEGSGS